MAEEKIAVYVRGACKSYGKAENTCIVLENFDMTVPRGTIYGLLGASGCGKTTLLSSIVGRRPLDSGDLVVLGGSPGDKESGVPGHRVGYMPQDVALMDSLTIAETMKYFSWIYGLPSEDFDKVLKKLLDLLELPDGKRLISMLSGGQQRRVSLMAALFHNPELLILDEPTVGVDPMLRQRVWDYLVQETKKYGKTVIITTHYIEEAKQANIIGMMRGGRLIAEDMPERLLTGHNTDSLETVFLVLSINQDRKAEGRDSRTTPALEEMNVCDYEANRSSQVEEIRVSCSKEFDLSKGADWESERKKRARTGKWKATFLKSGLRFFRTPGSLAFNFIFPIVQISIFFLAIGDDPRQLSFAIINKENINFAENCSDLTPMGCDDLYIGCRYANLLSKSKYFQVTYMEEREEALEAVRKGNAWGALIIPENFTELVKSRRSDGLHADDDLLNSGVMNVYLDMSNSQIGSIIQRQLLTEYKTFSGDLMSACELSPKLAKTPIKFEDPIYGSHDSTFQEFSASATILITIFFLAVGMTATVMVTERFEGLWDRTLVAGVTAWEMLVGHILMQTIMVLLQSIECLFIALVVFGFPCRGPVILSLLLTCLQGVAGMCCGFFVSVSSSTISETNYFSIGFFYPVVLMGGYLWPLQGSPWLFQKICQLMPATTATTAMRHIMIRGWGIQKSTVLIGFASSFAWIAVFLVLCYVILRIKQ